MMPGLLLDTSVLVAVNKPGEAAPDLSVFDEVFVSSLSYSEMRLGLATAKDIAVLRRRQALLDDLIDLFGEGIPYDDKCATQYGRIVVTAVEHGANARTNTIDRMIAATAAANDLTLATRNAADLKGLDSLVNVIAV